ncbi:kinase-like domain-containing protein [Mycena pura]|uniref:Kinase-like domain-containing protein n=1 Tax=Mycena pura TaxID=153505 RepID=A0AAD6VEH6_9AGAR|nr:kinase-like domain-containing protein [Mycena pura]
MSDSDHWLFVYPDKDDSEPSNGYKIGGFCPFKLGDVLGDPPRYIVMVKLGFGDYSTVWLARDRVLSRTVALKILDAKQTGQSRELDILRRLEVPASVSSKDPRPVQLLDSFETTSANGVHQVLVTDVVIPLLPPHPYPSSFKPRITRNVLRQLVQTLAFIHSRGIAHGDLYPTNFGLAVRNLDRCSETMFWRKHDLPRTFPLVPCSPDLDPNSFPPYLCPSMDWNLRRFLLKESPMKAQLSSSVRILDFGSAYVADGSPAPRCQARFFYAAPEVAFPEVALEDYDAPWDQRSDIWSLAIAVSVPARLLGVSIPISDPQFHDLVVAQGIYGSLSESDPKSLPHLMAALCGGVPDAWHEYIASRAFPLDWTPAHTAELWKKIEADFEVARADDPPGLVRLLRRMMILDPAKRPTAARLLGDPYFHDDVQDLQSNRAFTPLPSSAFLHMAKYVDLSDWEGGSGSGTAWLYVGTLCAVLQVGLRMPLFVVAETKFVAELCMSLGCFFLGRPTASTNYIDCPYPTDPPEVIAADNGQGMSYLSWWSKYGVLMHSIMSCAFGAKVPSYTTILELDRKVRDFYVPPQLRTTCAIETPRAGAVAETTLLNLHRAYFAQALQDKPDDLANHRFIPSVMVAYRSAWRLIRSLVTMWRD